MHSPTKFHRSKESLSLSTFLAIALAGIVIFAAPASAEDWPQWRGPEGTGVSHETNLPLNWNDQRGIIWKSNIPEWGDSTPAIFGNSIFLTAQHDDNLLVLKLDKSTGHILWTKTVGAGSVERRRSKPSRPKSAARRSSTICKISLRRLP